MDRNERMRLWRLKNPLANAAAAKSWRERNPEKAAEGNRRWRAANKEKVRESARRWRERTKYESSQKRKAQSLKDGLRVHGLTVEDYRALLAKQSGGCAICSSREPRMKGAKRMYVDHCHKADVVRGLLCHRCNLMLGAADDSPERLRAAARYLEGPDSGLVRSARRGLLESS